MACARTWDHNAVSKTFVVWRFRAPVSWHWLEINIVFKTHYLIHVFWFIYFFLDVGYTFLILHFFASLLLWCINHVLGWFSLNKQGLLVKIEPGFIHSTSSVPPKKKQQTTLIFQTEHRAQRHGAEYILIPAVAQATTLLTYTYQTVNLYGRAFLGSKK